MSQNQTAFIFPGQGAQMVGMGKDFVESYQTARETFEEADDILGEKLSEIAFGGPEDRLTETRNSQTAIYVMSIALLRVIQEQFPELKPRMTGGLSLGEYTALTASGRLDFNDCLPLVQWRGQVMNDACEATLGTMAVVMGLDGEVVEQLVADLKLPDALWAANFNCPGQVVISGTEAGVAAGAEAAKAKGAKRVIPLQVHGAFHSGLMVQAEERLAPRVMEAPLRDSEIGLVMNVTGKQEQELETIRQQLIKQVTSPVRWESCVRTMMDGGMELFIEIGPGKTLQGMNKRIGVPVPTVSVSKVADLETLANALAASAL